MSTLELRSITHAYPGATAPAVVEASVVVPDGAMVSIVGPSGSGKSTLLRLAAGLERVQTGQVLLGGRDVGAEPTERRDLTAMFQQPLLFDHLDVGGNVAFAPRLAGVSRREARRIAERHLRLVHLEGYAGRSVGSLSGGQQQRVALARALAAERGVLLLDEPFGSLDRGLREAMHDLLGELRAVLEPTILMVTHDLDEAALADSTAVLVEGRVEQQAPMTDLYRRPASLAVARLLGGFAEVVGGVREGLHHSAWGEVPVAQGVADGDAVLLVRREALHLTREVDGPGIDARVARRRASGTRSVLSLETSAGEVEVEVAGDDPTGVGARVRVAPAAGERHWALPADAQTRTSRTSDALR
ncbi:ABC transporter ATP-binding protein [Alteromonas gracilis]